MASLYIGESGARSRFRRSATVLLASGYVEANFPAGLKKVQYIEGKSGRVNAIINNTLCCACAI